MAQNSTRLLRRLNPYCAQALSAAASLCQSRAHGVISIEHWLLKLLEQGEGDLSLIARRYEWDMDAIWRGLLDHLDILPRSVQAKPQLCGKLQQLIKNAWLQASLDGSNDTLRSAHLLGALLETPGLLDCEAAWPLLSISNTQLERLFVLLDQHSEERPRIQQEAALERTEMPVTSGTVTSEALQAVLDRFTLDVTAKARVGQIDPVFGRDDEIRQVIDILSRRRKNNPILVGEPGVGKTALVEGLALRIAEGNVPDSLKQVSVRTLDLGLLQAGAGVKGEFEQRLKNVIDAVQQSLHPVLLFIDEAHTLIGAGNQAGGADAANLLKPALARGELRTIAATTWSEYKQYFERDAALERRFQMVKVDEPDDANASLMLRGLKARYASHHGVHIQDAAVQAAVNLSRRYLTGRQLPDKAVDLLDTASARVRMSLDCEPQLLVRLKARQTALELERQALVEDQQLSGGPAVERLAIIAAQQADLHHQQAELDKQYRHELELTQQLLDARQAEPPQVDACLYLQQQLSDIQGSQPLLSLDVDARSVAEVIADWTGVPLGSLLKDEQANLLELEQQLGEQVIGQDHVLGALAQRLRAAKTGLTDDKAPLGVFLLVGTSGVGKTETALALADRLFGGEKSLITINLSEYQEAHTVSQLKGSPPGYVGYGQGGVLTEAVRQRPYSVVLLDEVEKAHPDVLNLFYQVFDRGCMRDGEGREIDFRNTVILMTSNLGSDELQSCLQEFPDAPDSTLHELLRPILREHFQPALLARFQTLIYRPLRADALTRIVALKLAQVAKRLQRHYGLNCQIEAALNEALVAACLLPDTGARNIDSLLNQQILPVLSQQLLQRQAVRQKTSAVTLGYSDEEGIVLHFTDAQDTTLPNAMEA
ncbi:MULTISPECIES: type VI secretion system ATPase TssH [unclassified Pseudomonas]|uniref:type VI secretion system ATPase TssH n=1 Tax=unclassified Pseudomonas TaxID=196821 RepID=UPI000C87A538|nr:MULTISPECIES: type VI secretion system ATPase TssH [unclassified Pseudomonas]PMU08678.1 type VI secretion system ATPase TssH [Pseudomonas sp. FW305-20]PMU19521.1 type VI secretion system ATPase TssH [Pseudomonas sp. FW305-122]PMU38583.1 type VI secretion system ATPase TssH [Pseudomonas sp. FW305-47B]PMX59456.1 type VI secretion system ATPase TssH [Pseudomonas sp. FW305-33]PMX69516.1 type VI secretion system ATPase TssH [Pseudomonas sp. FW305-60]